MVKFFKTIILQELKEKTNFELFETFKGHYTWRIALIYFTIFIIIMVQYCVMVVYIADFIDFPARYFTL